MPTTPPDPGQFTLTFGEHLDELRGRVIKSLLAVVITFCVCYSYAQPLMDVVTDPMLHALAELGYSPRLIATKAQEKFIAYLKISGLAALFFASPVIMYQAWRFVAAGLYRHEQRYVLVFAPISLLSFLSGALFFYFLVMPWGLKFLLAFGDPTDQAGAIEPLIQVSEHISFFMLLSIVMGLAFELPLVMLFCCRIGIVTPDQFAAHRKLALIATLVGGAALTPPDVFTQVMLALPMAMLYEIGILVGRVGLVGRRPERSEEAPTDPAEPVDEDTDPVAPEAPAPVKINLVGVSLLLLPTLLITGMVIHQLTRGRPTRPPGAGKQRSAETFVSVMAGLDGVPAIVWERLLEDRDAVVRLTALRQLARLRPATLAARLSEAMEQDPDPAVQIEAAFQLWSVAGRIEPARRRLVGLLAAAPPRYAYLAHRMLCRASGVDRTLPVEPSTAQITEAVTFWDAWRPPAKKE